MPVKLLIDCDPGVDDAIALLLAAGNPDAEVVAITTVAGNQTLEKVTLNARRVATIAGLGAVPVAAGCDRPLLRDQILAAEIHGESGMDGPAYFEPTVPLAGVHGVDLIVETVLSYPGEVTLVPIGPLTNVAAALRREPRIAELVAGVVLMGGSYTRGNTTAAAEFNILVDPEAAAVVFGAGWPLTMVGLDVTQQARATTDVVGRIAALGTPVATFVLDLLHGAEARMAALGATAPLAVHDAVAVACAIDPSLVQSERAHVAIELRGEHTYGMTVTDFRCRNLAANTEVPRELDPDRFWSTLVDSLSRVGSVAG